MFEAQLTDIPNDLYVFGAWLKGKQGLPALRGRYLDLERINKNTLGGLGSDICKVSVAVLPHILDEYIILPVGATLVKNLSPKIVAGKNFTLENKHKSELMVPGKNTTAFLLMKILCPEFTGFCEMPYNEILSALDKGDQRPALVIHSTPALEEKYGLKELVNLSELWFKKSHESLLPLGCLVAKRSLGKEKLSQITKGLVASVSYAEKKPSEILDFVFEKSAEKNKDSILEGLKAWVNEETVYLSKKGRNSLLKLLAMAGFSPSKEIASHLIFEEGL